MSDVKITFEEARALRPGDPVRRMRGSVAHAFETFSDGSMWFYCDGYHAEPTHYTEARKSGNALRCKRCEKKLKKEHLVAGMRLIRYGISHGS